MWHFEKFNLLQIKVKLPEAHISLSIADRQGITKKTCCDMADIFGVSNTETWKPPNVDRLNELVRLSYMCFVSVCLSVWKEIQSLTPNVHRKWKLMHSWCSALTSQCSSKRQLQSSVFFPLAPSCLFFHPCFLSSFISYAFNNLLLFAQSSCLHYVVDTT